MIFIADIYPSYRLGDRHTLYSVTYQFTHLNLQLEHFSSISTRLVVLRLRKINKHRGVSILLLQKQRKASKQFHLNQDYQKSSQDKIVYSCLNQESYVGLFYSIFLEIFKLKGTFYHYHISKALSVSDLIR